MSSLRPKIDPSSITWRAQKGSQVELRCPVCLCTQMGTAVLGVPSLADGKELTLFTCANCDSLYFDPPGISQFSDIQENSGNFAKSYAEVVGGIWEMYWPAAASTKKANASLLDVGCGFGFTVDVWRQGRGEALGLELADYGRVGAKMLNVPIHFDYLQNISELQSRKFDVVYASEVIEHVPNPQEFADLLSRHIAADGVLCLTTPNAEYICEKNTGSTLLAALAPGFHGFLIGPAALENILRNCGFSHVLVKQQAERLVAWASMRPLDVQVGATKTRREYLHYLDHILSNRKENDFVTDGIAYRKFRDNTLAGQYENAFAALQRLQVSLNEKYPMLLLDEPEQTLAQIRQIDRPEDFGVAFPWFLPNFYYVRAVYAKLIEHNEVKARNYFHSSRELTNFIAQSWGMPYVMEAIGMSRDAWRQEAISAALAGDLSVCEELVGMVQHQSLQVHPQWKGETLTCRYIETIYMDGLSIYYKLKPEYLEETLTLCVRYLKIQYGEWWALRNSEKDNFPCVGLSYGDRLNFLFTMATVCIKLQKDSQMLKALLNQILFLARKKSNKSQRVVAIINQSVSLLRRLSGENADGSVQTRGVGAVNYSVTSNNKLPK